MSVGLLAAGDYVRVCLSWACCPAKALVSCCVALLVVGDALRVSVLLSCCYAKDRGTRVGMPSLSTLLYVLLL